MDETLSLSLGHMQRSNGSTAASKGQTNNIAIKVDTTKEYMRDNHGSDPELSISDEKIDMGEAVNGVREM